MSKTIEEIKTKELLGKVALANGYSCMAEMSVTNSDKDIRIAVLKYQLDEIQSQTQELQEQNAELVRLLEELSKTTSGSRFLRIKREAKELLTKYNQTKSHDSKRKSIRDYRKFP